MTLGQFNNLGDQLAFEELLKCCGSTNWAKAMVKERPFRDLQDLQKNADQSWSNCSVEDGLEAFSHHPKIGDKESLEKKFASTKAWAGNEQSGVDTASSETFGKLVIANEEYLTRFGFIFIVFATGKSAEEMLAILESRLQNDREEEIRIAMAEQHKITKLRINKLIGMSQITTHVLDTARGLPAEGIRISIQKSNGDDQWESISSGVTNSDGRIPDFIEAGQILPPGRYRMLFETGSYFERLETKGFYPFVPVVFEIEDMEHYHIPLLLNPFGYSTYRGS